MCLRVCECLCIQLFIRYFCGRWQHNKLQTANEFFLCIFQFNVVFMMGWKSCVVAQWQWQ